MRRRVSRRISFAHRYFGGSSPEHLTPEGAVRLPPQILAHCDANSEPKRRQEQAASRRRHTDLRKKRAAGAVYESRQKIVEQRIAYIFGCGDVDRNADQRDKDAEQRESC